MFTCLFFNVIINEFHGVISICLTFTDTADMPPCKNQDYTGSSPWIDKMAEDLISLDVWDKLLILAGVALVMVLVIVILMCVLSPYCCLFQYCPFRDKTPHG